MRYPKRSQYRYAKSRYQVQNWAQYEAGLQIRRALTVWLSDTGECAGIGVIGLCRRQSVQGLYPPIPGPESLSFLSNPLQESRDNEGEIVIALRKAEAKEIRPDLQATRLPSLRGGRFEGGRSSGSLKRFGRP